MIMNNVDNYYLKLHIQCTYAHSWSERSEWIGSIFSKQDEFECQQKWEHILQYRRVGIYSVANGCTVAELQYYLTHNLLIELCTFCLLFFLVPRDRRLNIPSEGREGKPLLNF